MDSDAVGRQASESASLNDGDRERYGKSRRKSSNVGKSNGENVSSHHDHDGKFDNDTDIGNHSHKGNHGSGNDVDKKTIKQVESGAYNCVDLMGIEDDSSNLSLSGPSPTTSPDLLSSPVMPRRASAASSPASSNRRHRHHRYCPAARGDGPYSGSKQAYHSNQSNLDNRGNRGNRGNQGKTYGEGKHYDQGEGAKTEQTRVGTGQAAHSSAGAEETERREKSARGSHRDRGNDKNDRRGGRDNRNDTAAGDNAAAASDDDGGNVTGDCLDTWREKLIREEVRGKLNETLADLPADRFLISILSLDEFEAQSRSVYSSSSHFSSAPMHKMDLQGYQVQRDGKYNAFMGWGSKDNRYEYECHPDADEAEIARDEPGDDSHTRMLGDSTYIGYIGSRRDCNEETKREEKKGRARDSIDDYIEVKNDGMGAKRACTDSADDCVPGSPCNALHSGGKNSLANHGDDIGHGAGLLPGHAIASKCCDERDEITVGVMFIHGMCAASEANTQNTIVYQNLKRTLAKEYPHTMGRAGKETVMQGKNQSRKATKDDDRRQKSGSSGVSGQKERIEKKKGDTKGGARRRQSNSTNGTSGTEEIDPSRVHVRVVYHAVNYSNIIGKELDSLYKRVVRATCFCMEYIYYFYHHRSSSYICIHYLASITI